MSAAAVMSRSAMVPEEASGYSKTLHNGVTPLPARVNLMYTVEKDSRRIYPIFSSRPAPDVMVRVYINDERER